MKTKTSSIVRYRMKKPGIFQSEHEPFLPGNIAKRGVIETISRKAISPLDSSSFNHCKQVNLSFLFLKIYSRHRERIAIKSYRSRFFDHRKTERLEYRNLLFSPPEDYIQYAR